MLFNTGIYQHKDGFKIRVDSTGEVMISPNHPVSARLSEFFNNDNWTLVSYGEDDTETESE